jgi:hypothetical protein
LNGKLLSNRKFIFTFALILGLMTLPAATFAEDDPPMFYLPVDAKEVSGLTQIDLVLTAAAIHTAFQDELRAKNWKLTYDLRWESPYFGAGIPVHDGDQAVLTVFGGLVRAPGMNHLVLAATLCHEFGHILGGEPYQHIPDYERTSAEGQSDDFAARRCLPRVAPRLPALRAEVGEGEFDEKGEVRPSLVARAGLELMRFMQRWAVRGDAPVAIETPAPERPRETLHTSYPSIQCRLDTFVEASKGHERPACWYRAGSPD